MRTTYLELIQRGARLHPNRIAVVFEDKRLTFQQIDQLSNRLSNTLTAQGIKKNDRVALLLDNGLYSIPLDFTCVKTGINRVPLNSRLSVHEHYKMLLDTSCNRLIYGHNLADHVLELKALMPDLECYGIGTNKAGGKDLLIEAEKYTDQAPEIEVSPDDVVLTLFTSGTTGTLKAVQHTQASYASICENLLLNLIDVRQDDAMLYAASLIHASGCFVLPFWIRGARAVILPSFDPGTYLETLTRERITSINLVPTMLQMLLDHPDFSHTDVSCLRQVIYGASPMPRPVIKKAIQIWGYERFWQYFGQTECPIAIAVLHPEDHKDETLLGACGRPSLGLKIRLVDEDGNDVPDGKAGEVVVHSPTMMIGYFNAPELNKEMFMEGGWLRTRDIGQFDDRGFLYLKDRTSDMIITGGYNVYPREIEDILVSHPAVSECAVIGIKDPKWVEAVTGVVALKPGHKASREELIDFVRGQVASYKIPQNIIFMDSIPKTAVGKLSRRLLRQKFQRE